MKLEEKNQFNINSDATEKCVLGNKYLSQKTSVLLNSNLDQNVLRHHIVSFHHQWTKFHNYHYKKPEFKGHQQRIRKPSITKTYSAGSNHHVNLSYKKNQGFMETFYVKELNNLIDQETTWNDSLNQSFCFYGCLSICKKPAS